MKTNEKRKPFEETSKTQICSNCGISESEWKGNQGRGYQQGEDIYCCQDCSEGAGCDCLIEK